METLDVRIVKLPAMRVASAHAYSSSPEEAAIQKLISWAKTKGLMNALKEYRIFGFNNPDPSPGSPNYGYEFWITVNADIQAEGDIKIKDFPGGMYAVARSEVRGDPEIISETWKMLVSWREGSRYQFGNHQWLEEHLDFAEDMGLNFTLDLYMPIAE